MDDTNGNRLARAVSPYLLQHRDNPVHWREWSAETLAEAKRLDRPILLSVGYAACHWCHVMAHESFEDEASAAVMNALFVNVKVDREERPDIDHIYMAALQAMGEQGGWPMTMFLTPDGEPFHGGTYYPKTASHGRPGFVELLEAVGRAWTDRRQALSASGGAVRAHLRQALARASAERPVPPDAAAGAADRLAALTDAELGGFRGAPKFPNAPSYELLARWAFPSGDPKAAEAFLLTVRSLCEGGIYDHVGGGLHRYSVDAAWLVPHFEKMLYDNAQFLRHCLWAYRATGEDLFRRRIEETVDWLEREMRLPGGGFAASLDADSLDEDGHMEEGAFYVWREAEIAAALGPDAVDFRRRYDVTPGGNWEGKVVLSRLAGYGADAADFPDRLATLRAIRERRPRPARDDKVLADWNGLAIRALAEVGAALGDERCLRLAREAFDHALAQRTAEGRLAHASRDGRIAGPALSGDYGALIAGGAQLFAATLDRDVLDEAGRLASELDRWHGDGEGGHFMTASDAGDVILRPRGDADDATPAATALVVEGLALLAQVGGDPSIRERAIRAGERAAGRIAEAPSAFPGILAALMRLQGGSEAALFGYRSNPGFDDMRNVLAETVDLDRVDFVVTDPARLPETLALSAFAPERYPAAILCEDGACRPPVFDVEALEALLAGRIIGGPVSER